MPRLVSFDVCPIICFFPFDTSLLSLVFLPRSLQTQPSPFQHHRPAPIISSPPISLPQLFTTLHRRTQIQALHAQSKRIAPTVAPRGIEIEPAAITVVEVDDGANQGLVAAVHFPDGWDDELPERRDDAGSAAGLELRMLGGGCVLCCGVIGGVDSSGSFGVGGRMLGLRAVAQRWSPDDVVLTVRGLGRH